MAQTKQLPVIKISPNKRFFITEDGKPFFWLGDTGWLLFGKTTREEAEVYLETRKKQGFNVVQVMLLHELGVVNKYGDSALKNRNVATPNIFDGNNFSDKAQYDFWDNVDYVVDLAASKGIYMAMVPVWGGNVTKGGRVTSEKATIYATFLANRYKNKSNIIWLNGGDIKGSDSMAVWNTIGRTLRANDPNHLITFHPRGRATSSAWFHNEQWLDFNMFQSGHKDYIQDTVEPRIGEDNWKFVQGDLALSPTKPTMDGEPSYEGIPHGLHEADQPYWSAADVRRYAYWNTFAGGAGFTYGDNAVMQFYSKGESGSSFFPKKFWQEAINDTGAWQMQYLKKLIISKPYFESVNDQSMLSENGDRYERVIANRGKKYAMFYTYTGGEIKTTLGKISGKKVKAYWYDPREGKKTSIGVFENKGNKSFKTPGQKKEGNDWVLVLETI